jgi:hypothetical protein
VGVLGQGAKGQGCYDGHDGGGESAIHIGFLGLIGTARLSARSATDILVSEFRHGTDAGITNL